MAARPELTIDKDPRWLIALPGLEPPEGELQHLGAAARAVIGGDEVVADPQRENEHAAGLDLVFVVTERAEQRTQVVHSPVVDAAQAARAPLVAPRPRPGGKGGLYRG